MKLTSFKTSRYQSFSRALGLIVLIGAAFGTKSAVADNGGLRTSVAVDLLASFPLDDNDSASVLYQSKESYKLRSAEFTLYAPIDTRFEGF